ncbi:DUF2220 family protein [Pseudomonas citronellolis]|uniref:Wadjet anti-phage system protein JetD domain-containing protein n=1 Tax=Pseudomonas citronellolis TaxID=53408 RepID=UPI00226E2C60|nr:Wadjet anti-phage system protein JetD domain-containing protein [Pseudomonas citronellolis]WAB91872.1 DUF2220 family protein [Pseudomonas citronellolis]
MSATIHRYLTKIEAGLAINFDVLLDRLVEAGCQRHELSRLFTSTRLGKTRYQVHITDPAAFATLIERFRPSGLVGRVGAALDGDSHRVSVSGTYLLIRSQPQPHPVVALYEAGCWHAPRPARSVGVIVENLENFLNLERTLALITSLLHRAPAEIELIYGSGNQVTNRLNTAFLETFSELHCLFDVDPGGLRMYATLRKQMPTVPLRFLAPADVEQLLRRSRYSLSEQGSQDILQYAGLSPETDQLIHHMRRQNSVLEQETYLLTAPGEGMHV